jgi:transposase
MVCHVGLDRGGETHAVCVLGADGAAVERFTIAHDRAGLADLADLIGLLGKRGNARDVHIAIERPSGLLVDALVEAGFAVVPIHPNVVEACRPRHRAVSAESDPGDAYILADSLRTDGHRLGASRPRSDAIEALRALVRGRDDLVATRVALANQLSALLDSFWPGAAALFAAIASPIAPAFLDRYPTPQRAARLGEKRMAAFLAQHHSCGRRSPADLPGRLRSAAIGCAGEAEAEAEGELVRASARTLNTLVAQLAARIEHEVAQWPEGRIVMSFSRAGKICAAQITAELGDVRARFATEDQLAAEAGVAPVTYASGKSRGVGWRSACNKRLRAAITCFADNSRHASAWAADVDQRARARGAEPAHAVRIPARARIRILWRARTGGAVQEPEKHPAARALNAAPQQAG